MTLLEPTDADLAAIEAYADVTDAEVALVDAECRWHTTPTPWTAADVLAAIGHLTDLYAHHTPTAATTLAAA